MAYSSSRSRVDLDIPELRLPAEHWRLAGGEMCSPQIEHLHHLSADSRQKKCANCWNRSGGARNELARRLGINQPRSVGDYRSGKRPVPDNLASSFRRWRRRSALCLHSPRTGAKDRPREPRETLCPDSKALRCWTVPLAWYGARIASQQRPPVQPVQKNTQVQGPDASNTEKAKKR